MRSLVLLVLAVGAVSSDDYVDEVQGRCLATNQTNTCAKYKLFKYLDDYHLGDVSLTSDSSVRFVNIPGGNGSVSRRTSRRHGSTDSEVVKIFKFLKRRLAKFVKEQGVAVELPAGARIVEETTAVSARKKKEKKSIFLPLLILFKVFKLKIMVHMVLVGVIIIKKMLLAAAIFLPGALAAIKAHCKQQQFHVVPYHVDEDHYTHSHEHEHEPSGFGASGFDDDKHFWAHKKKYSYL